MGQHQGVHRPFPNPSEVLERHRVECAGPHKRGKPPRLPNEALGKGKTLPRVGLERCVFQG